jgi:hypothetical protein
MIETAKHVITKSAVEQAVMQAKDAAESALEDLSERAKDAEVVQELRRKAKKELKKASKQLEKARKSKKSRRSRRAPRPVVLLAAVGFVALAVYLVQRRRNSSGIDIAPDPFGEAVEEERRAGAFGQSSVATPGA